MTMGNIVRGDDRTRQYKALVLRQLKAGALFSDNQLRGQTTQP